MKYNINPAGAQSYTTTIVDELDLTFKNVDIYQIFLKDFNPDESINTNWKANISKYGISYKDSNNNIRTVVDNGSQYYSPLCIYYDTNKWVIDREIKAGELVLVKGNVNNQTFTMVRVNPNSCTNFSIKGDSSGRQFKILVNYYSPNGDDKISIKNYAVLLYVYSISSDTNTCYAIPFSSSRGT